jgi:hypothetical protein
VSATLQGIRSTNPFLPWGAQLGALVCNLTALHLEDGDLLTTELSAFLEACPLLAEVQLGRDVGLTLPRGAQLAAPTAPALTKLVLGNYAQVELFAPLAPQLKSLSLPPPFWHFIVRLTAGDAAAMQQLQALPPNLQAQMMEAGMSMSNHFGLCVSMLKYCTQLEEVGVPIAAACN